MFFFHLNQPNPAASIFDEEDEDDQDPSEDEDEE